MNPLPKMEISKFIKAVRILLVPELNYTSQFGNVLRAAFGIEPIPLTKSEGLPFTSSEILRKIEELAAN
jgi:pyruvate/2-oxoacid:ferredoxin oxidoreductase alpha subunit